MSQEDLETRRASEVDVIEVDTIEVDTVDLAEKISFEDLQLIVRRLGEPEEESSRGLCDAVNAAYDRAIRRAGGRGRRKAGASVEAEERWRYSTRLYGLLKHLSDDTKARAYWHRLALADPTLDRDELLLDLWALLDRIDPEHVERIGSSAAYHRAWLFNLFLHHYDVRRGLKVLGASRWATNTPVLLLLVVGALFVLRTHPAAASLPAWRFTVAVVVAYAGVAALLGQQFRRSLSTSLEAGTLAFQSLMPRLAGAAAVGLVIMASSKELLELVTGIPLRWLVVPLGAGLLYLALEMVRRIHPLPRRRRLVRHVIDVGSIALCHALALTLVAERGLREILEPGSREPLGTTPASSVTVFLFAIGLIVNLIWAEQPVTEPL